jgi:predicted metalloendopeptidase
MHDANHAEDPGRMWPLTQTLSKNLRRAQRFFIGFAQWACANERPEDLRVRAQTDPHSPSFGDNLVTPCTKMQQAAPKVSPIIPLKAVASYT